MVSQSSGPLQRTTTIHRPPPHPHLPTVVFEGSGTSSVPCDSKFLGLRSRIAHCPHSGVTLRTAPPRSPDPSVCVVDTIETRLVFRQMPNDSVKCLEIRHSNHLFTSSLSNPLNRVLCLGPEPGHIGFEIGLDRGIHRRRGG